MEKKDARKPRKLRKFILYYLLNLVFFSFKAVAKKYIKVSYSSFLLPSFFLGSIEKRYVYQML